MQRTYYTDSDTLNDYLEHGCDDGTTVTAAAIDQAASEIAHKSRYSWSDAEALAFLATVTDDERRAADAHAHDHSDPGVTTRSIGYHACRVAFFVVRHAAVLDLRAALADIDAIAAHHHNSAP